MSKILVRISEKRLTVILNVKLEKNRFQAYSEMPVVINTVQPVQCGVGRRRDCPNKDTCIYRHLNETVGELISKYVKKKKKKPPPNQINAQVQDPVQSNTPLPEGNIEKDSKIHEMCIGTFNVRGMINSQKQRQLKRDMDKYGVDVCTLQETKIKNGLMKKVYTSNFMSFKSNQKAYGNGFIVSARFVNRIFKSWKVNDRIAVLQLNMDIDINTTKASPRLFNIISVYAPTTDIARRDPNEVEKLYNKLTELLNKLNSNSNSTTIIAGDFNSKVGRREHDENITCLGKFSRGRRNQSGLSLINFCELNGMFIANSAFRHSARHITTHTHQYINQNGIPTTSFSQIDYILVPIKRKQCLYDARSYAGTEVDSDHKLVVARMKIDPFILFKRKINKSPSSIRFDTQKLQDPEIKSQYQEIIKNSLDTLNKNQETTWEKIEEVVRDASKNVLGYQRPAKKKGRKWEEEIEKLSLESKGLRMRIINCTDLNDLKNLKATRNKTSHKIRDLQKRKHTEKLQNIVNRIGKAESSSKMYEAVKDLNRKSTKPLFVHDKKGKVITSPDEIYKIATDHFTNHFKKDDQEYIERFVGNPAPMLNPISTDEVSKALSRMTNNRAAFDEISAECLKYGPPELHEEIKNALNNLIEKHININIGAGKIALLEKPKKPMPGPVKDLRPITLLKVIRKTLSKITLERLKPKMERYLSHSQCAYRGNRSTTDVVWSYRFLLAKVQEYNLTLYSTGIDMTAAFDTIIRSEIIKIIEEIGDEDDVRLVRALLSESTLEIHMKDFDGERIVFQCNIGSPQGDGLSGPLFTLYLEKAMRDVRAEMQCTPIPSEHSYPVNSSERQITAVATPQHDYHRLPAVPDEMTYADDADFVSKSLISQNKLNKDVGTLLKKHNLLVNNEKTENLTLMRGNRNTEMWRQSTKLGSKLGDIEDINMRKALAIDSFNKMHHMWIKGQAYISLSDRLDLFDALVISVFRYNSSCWGLRKTDIISLNSFHRNLLRKVCNIKWPDRISNIKLYRLTKRKPIIIDITTARWKYFGHVLRMHPSAPPKAAMAWFFTPEEQAKRFRGAKRTTIATTLHNDIKDTLCKFPNFQIVSFANLTDFQNCITLASNRNLWRKIVKTVTDTVQANYLRGD